MYTIKQPAVGDKKILKVTLSTHTVIFEPGDEVEIIGIGERGYDLLHKESGHKIYECRFDIFETDKTYQKEPQKVIRVYSEATDRCILRIGDKYFAYSGEDLSHPEGLVSDKKNAHIFHYQNNAIGMAAYFNEKRFDVLPL